MFEDKTIVCKDCGEEFLFTAGEQGFYLEKGLLNEPQRCAPCREKRRAERTEPLARRSMWCRAAALMPGSSCSR